MTSKFKSRFVVAFPLVLACKMALAVTPSSGIAVDGAAPGSDRSYADAGDELHLRSTEALNKFPRMMIAANAPDTAVVRPRAGDRYPPLDTPSRLAPAPTTAPVPPEVAPTPAPEAVPSVKRKLNLKNPAMASDNVAPETSADDEILHLLRESDKAFAGPAIALPDGMGNSMDAQPQGLLSLEEALARTLQNSYSYAATSAQAEGAIYAKKAALGQLGPAIDVSGQRGREYSAPASIIDPTTGLAQISNTHIRWDSTLLIRQPIFSPTSYFDYRKQASLAVAADLRKEDAREALYYQAIKAYYDLLRGYAMLTFAQSYADRMESLQDYMNKRMEGGGASKVDFERVRGRALTAKSAVIEAEGVLESAVVSLVQLTGVRAQQLGVPSRMMPVVPLSSQLALEHIYDSNAAVRAARQDVEAASQELKSARARFSPTLSVEITQARSRNVGGDPTLTTDRRYMLVMNMNLLNGGSDYYYQKEIGSKFVEKSNTASDIERKLKEQIEINYRTLDAVRKRIDVARQAYQTNAGVADVFLDQLTTGNKQLLDVLDAYQQAYQSRVDLASLLFLQADISYQILRNTGRASAFVEQLNTP
jgi:adhesin transport system outer membrane protein